MSGRSLTSGEILLVQSVFGNNIDLTKVRVFNGYWNLFHEIFAAGSIIAPDGNIYWPNIGHPSFAYSPDFSKLSTERRALFLHEMAHVYEVQSTGKNLTLSAIAQPLIGGNFFQLREQYNIRGIVTAERDWESFTIEQKAEIIRTIFIVANNGTYQGYTKEDLDLLVSKLPFAPGGDLSGSFKEVFDLPLPPMRSSRCFLAGTPILMADGSTKPIEAIRPGDEVAAFDPDAQQGLGPLRPGKVTRTFTNVTRSIINLRGLHMTPGHVVLMDNGEWDIIARALKDDRAIVEEREGPDGSCSDRNRLSPRNDGVGQVAGGPTMFSIKRSRLGRRSPVSGWRNPDCYARKPERIVTSTISRN